MKKCMLFAARSIGIAIILTGVYLYPALAAVDPSPGPMSATVKDPNSKDWKEYDNYLVKVHLRINSAWTLMEFKETKDTGSIGLTLSRSPLATFSVTRESISGDFEDWVSSPSLSTIYPSGYKKSRTEFAGRKAVLIKGMAKDERLDESYFTSEGGFVNQVSFTAPADEWNRFQPAFDELRRSFRWLK